MKEAVSDRIDVGRIFLNVKPVLIRWIVALAMAANDLPFLANKIRDSQVDYEQFYFFRLALAHLKEIAKIIGKSAKNEIIKTFISKLNNEAQNTYKKLSEELGHYDKQSFVKNILKIPRDETFHYPDIEGKNWHSLSEDVKGLDKILVEFNKNDRTIMGTRYRFIDILISQRINKNLSKGIVNQLSGIAVDLISFVDYIFEYLTTIK